MPEALAVVLVFFVCIAIYIAARFQRQSAGDPAVEMERLKQHEAWLRERLLRAERENWGPDMTAGIAKELRATTQEIDRARVRLSL